MKMTRGEVKVLAAKITTVLSSEEELTFDAIHALSRAKSSVGPEIESMGALIASWQKKEVQLSLKFCDKDLEGKPIVRNERYAGLETGKNPVYDAEMEKAVAARIKYFKEEIEVVIHYIDKEDVPKKGKAFVLETLCYFIKD